MSHSKTRREFTKSFGALIGTIISLPGQVRSVLGQTSVASPLIDAHAHVFNASDLPARSFLKLVFLGHYPAQGTERLLNLNDRDVLDWLLRLFVSIAGSNVPTAAHEIDVLEGRVSADPASATEQGASEETIRRSAEFLRTATDRNSRQGPRRGKSLLTDALLRAGGVTERRLLTTMSDNQLQDVAARAFRSRFDVGVYLRWFSMFRRYRYSLVDELADDHRKQGFNSILLAPALVDYSKWLGEETVSPLADQIAVMSRISRRSTGPAIHGYVAFDPLRDVYFARGKDSRADDRPNKRPLDLVREALTQHGFIGVKLYPPMGFKPAANSKGQEYPKRVLDDLGETVSDSLNRSLDELYSLCAELGAPILSHTAETNGAGPGYASRADPAYWIPVLQKWPQLHVCLAHFGHFSYVSATAPSGIRPPASSWEWTFGRFVKEHPQAPLFADVSYFSEILDPSAPGRKSLADKFIRFAAQFDPKLEHLMFGTDWIMIGQEKGYRTYAQALVQFLKTDCHFDDDVLERILVKNSASFLGLVRGHRTRERLLDFYRTNGIPEQRLPET
jgi:predicted TIM-barrel fold metal-dependent hydrolase